MHQKPDLTSSRIAVEEDVVEAYEFLYAHKYTDGLPVIPPTERRVMAMIDGSGRDPNAVIAVLPPVQGEATVEKIAINAVMAGCHPNYMPVVIAAVEAMTRPAFNLAAIQVTTHPVTPMILINGPVRTHLEINSASNVLGQGWRANATIGRALRLIMVNIGGAIPGEVDKATQGQPGKYTFCFGENEEESPWEPLHTERGFQKDESTVTLVGAAGTVHIIEPSSDGAATLQSITYGIISAGSNNFNHPPGEPMLLLCPTHAQLLAEIGYTKDRLKQHLFEHARAPEEWITQSRLAQRGSVAPAENGLLPMAERWQNFMVAVAGGPGALHSTFIPTFANTEAQTQRIDIPS